MRSEPLVVEIARSIRVRHIQTVRSSLLTFDENHPAGSAAKRLRARGFDFAPVTRGGEIVARASQADLAKAASTVGDVSTEIRLGDFVSAETPIGDLLGAFGTAGILFVLDRRSISGIVTPSDLNKQAARTHFYMIVAAVEMGLCTALRAVYRDQREALAKLTPERQAPIVDRFDRDQATDTEADLIAQFELADVFTVVALTPDLVTRLGTTTSALKRLGGHCVTVRNDIMHPSRLFLGSSRSADWLATLDGRLMRLLESVGTLPVHLQRAPTRSLKPRGLTPEALAAEMGLRNAKSLRAYLRRRHPRPGDQKWTRWAALEQSVVADVRANFHPRSP